jgi:hypothetical protein
MNKRIVGILFRNALQSTASRSTTEWVISSLKHTAKAVIIHDYLNSAEGQKKHGYYRAKADDIFDEALRALEYRRVWFAWAAVRIFGQDHNHRDHAPDNPGIVIEVNEKEKKQS